MYKTKHLVTYQILLLLSIVSISKCFSQTYNFSADYSDIDSYPLQKTQFGVSYVPASDIHIENVYDLLKVRNSRNNDKRLTGTWVGWNLDGDPIYERNNYLSTLLENAGNNGAIGGANLQGPYEHPAVETYRASS
jgi:hypothetical protein